MRVVSALLVVLSASRAEARKPSSLFSMLVTTAAVSALDSADVAEELAPRTAEDVLKKYKDMLPMKDVEQKPLPDHKGNPVWLHQWVRANDVYMLKALKGQVGFASDFEKETGRYIVDFEEGADGRKQFALHPATIELAEKPEGATTPKAKKAKKKDEL